MSRVTKFVSSFIYELLTVCDKSSLSHLIMQICSFVIIIMFQRASYSMNIWINFHNFAYSLFLKLVKNRLKRYRQITYIYLITVKIIVYLQYIQISVNFWINFSCFTIFTRLILLYLLFMNCSLKVLYYIYTTVIQFCSHVINYFLLYVF